MEASESPATTVRTEVSARPPEVGFCLSGSPGISSSATLQMARIGVPSDVKSVYFACTDVTNAAKLLTLPHCSTTSGGEAFFLPRLSSVGTQQANSCSTRATTLASIVSVASKKSSMVSLHGSAPVNSGGPADFEPRAFLRSHLADFEIDSSFGLNWNGIRSTGAPGLLPPPTGVAS